MAMHLLEIPQRRANAALRAAGCIAMALWSSSCLVTDALEEEPPAPVPVNHPVVIVEDSVSPKDWAPIQVTRSSSPPCTQVLEAKQVTDEDTGDSLAARWFIDCATAPSVADWKTCKEGDDIPLWPVEEGSVSRVGPPLTLTMKNLKNPGLHIVKLLVSDQFEVGRPEVKEGYSLATYEWVVIVASDCQGVTP